MSTLLGAVRQFGLHHMLQLRRARIWGWEGMLRGHVLTRVVQTLLDTGLLDTMQRDGHVEVSAFAAARGLDSRLLLALCDYLAARRILRRVNADGYYMLDDHGAFLMASDALRGWVELTHGYEDVLHAMPDLLARRRQYAPGDVQRDGHYVAVGSGRASSDFFFPLVADLVRRGGYRHVLDLGCGDAKFLRYLCVRVPGTVGVGIDRSPAAVAAARAQIEREGLADRVHVMCGDAIQVERYRDELHHVDAATCFFVLHELYSDARDGAVEPFLVSYRRALPGVPLIAIEAIRPSLTELRRRPGPAAEYSLLHDLSGQTTIARGAWRDVLVRAGFTDVREDHFDFARSSIYSAR
jgi:SAM-dependent methyltransferase